MTHAQAHSTRNDRNGHTQDAGTGLAADTDPKRSAAAGAELRDAADDECIDRQWMICKQSINAAVVR